MQKFTFSLLALAVAAVTTLSCVNEDEGNRIKTGDAIPSFTVNGPDGTISSADFSKGGLIVLFASYCPTCQTVMPQIQKLWESSDEGALFTIANLSRQNVYGEDEQSVAEYWEERGYTMPYYLDTNGEVYYRFAKETIPRVYVIDKSRKITFMSVGNGQLTAGELADELEKALVIEIDL